MYRLNIGRDLYLKGRIGWKGLSKDEYLEKSDYKIINATALMDGFVDWEKCGYISKERYDESEEIMLQENDILISKDGTLGKIGYVKGLPSYCTVASGIFVLRNTKPTEVDFDYLYHLLKSNIFKSWIKANKAEGSTINHLYQCDLERFEIDLPCLAQQEGIAKILNDIDDKIALNRSMNQTLEAMAKQLYDYWFVQFDFPDKNGKPYKSSGGKMVWNEMLKREIPEGWEAKKLEEISEICNGATPSTINDDNYGGDIIWITPKDLSDQKSKFTSGGERRITQQGYDSCSTRMLPPGTILMSSRAPIGLLSIALCELCTNQGFKSIIPNELSDNLYLYYYLKTHMKQIEQMGSGTTFKEVSRESMNTFPLLYVSDRSIYSKWVDLIAPIFSEQENLQKEILHLQSFRDTLLPLLMNGQVTIKN